MKQRKIFFFFLKNQNGWPQKTEFFNSTSSWHFFQKIHRLVLGLVELNDVKGIDVALPIWPWGCTTYAPKRPKNTKNAVFACIGAYVGQAHGHKGWATSMLLTPFNPTSPRTNPWNFGQSWKTKFLWEGHFDFFFKKEFFCFIPMKISHKLCVRIDGTQFLLSWWFTAKNEHEGICRIILHFRIDIHTVGKHYKLLLNTDRSSRKNPVIKHFLAWKFSSLLFIDSRLFSTKMQKY